MSKKKRRNRVEIREYTERHNECNADWICAAFFNRRESVDRIANAFGLSYSAVRTFLFKRYETHIYHWTFMRAADVAAVSARLNRQSARV